MKCMKMVLTVAVCLAFVCTAAAISDEVATSLQVTPETIPPAWEILPIPRYVDYDSPKSFLTLKNVAVVRRPGGPYQTVRDESGELVGQSTITEGNLVQLLKENGVQNVTTVADNLPDYSSYDTLILLGKPEHNSKTAKLFKAMKLSFAKWYDPHTPENDFNNWKDFGKEGYLLKVSRHKGKNIIILAGYDYDDKREKFYGAGTFYALQSLSQLISRDGNTIRVKTGFRHYGGLAEHTLQVV